MAADGWPQDEIRTVDRAWRWAAFLVLVANIILAVVELSHYGGAYDSCGFDNHTCRTGVTGHLNASQGWMMVAALPALGSLFLPLNQKTTPWRMACVVIVAVCFLARLILMTAT